MIPGASPSPWASPAGNQRRGRPGTNLPLRALPVLSTPDRLGAVRGHYERKLQLKLFQLRGRFLQVHEGQPRPHSPTFNSPVHTTALGLSTQGRFAFATYQPTGYPSRTLVESTLRFEESPGRCPDCPGRPRAIR